jgi:hypothetical protein
MSFSVDDPASQPYVTGVGGTHLSGSGSSLQESVWNSGGGAGGGGLSAHWSTPSFQSGIPAATHRAVPDVSALADPYSGYPLLYTQLDKSQPNYGYEVVGISGGTSGAAPVWAAVIAQANAANPCLVGRAGYLNPLLYKASYGTAFRDVVSGNNDIADAAGTYSATTGYDLATGLGAPKAGLGASLCQNQGASTFQQLAGPVRVVSAHKLTAGTYLTAKVGVSPIPSSGVSAVVADITVSGTGGNGWATGYPAGVGRPGVVSMSWTGTGVTRRTVATIPVEPNGAFSFYSNQSGTFSIDVLGYYAKSTKGLSYNAVKTPARLLDTRSAVGVTTRTPISNSTITFKVGGQDGIPSDVQSVLLNVSTVSAVGSGSLTAYAGGGTKPSLSQMYWDSAVPLRTSLLPVPVKNGMVSIAVSGKTHVVADVFGYYYSSGARFFPLAQGRLASGSLTAKSLHVYQVAGVRQIPSGVTAVALTISTSTDPSGGTIQVWGDPTRVSTSAVLWTGGQLTSNQVIVPVGSDGKIDLYTSSATNIGVDIAGYFK